MFLTEYAIYFESVVAPVLCPKYYINFEFARTSSFHWRFIGHILRQQPDNDCVTALTWTPEGKRKRSRPKTTWRRTVEKERSKAGWQSWREVRTAAQDRNRWRAHVEALCTNLAPGDEWVSEWVSVSILLNPWSSKLLLSRYLYCYFRLRSLLFWRVADYVSTFFLGLRFALWKVSLIHNCKLVNLFGRHLTVSLLQGNVVPFLLCFSLVHINCAEFRLLFHLFSTYVGVFLSFPHKRGCIPFWTALKVSS